MLRVWSVIDWRFQQREAQGLVLSKGGLLIKNLVETYGTLSSRTPSRNTYGQQPLTAQALGMMCVTKCRR